MKKSVKKNKNIQKRSFNNLKRKEEIKKHFKIGYITATTINLSSSYTYNSKEQTVLNTLKKDYFDKKFNLKIIDGNKLTEYEFLYTSRYSDITIYFIDEKIRESIKENLEIVLKNSKNNIFCINSKTNRKLLKNIIEKHSVKTVNITNLLTYIPTIKLKENTIRSVLFPLDVKEEEDQIIVKTYIKKGIVSKKFVCNGIFNLEIDQIEVENKIYNGSELEVDEIEYAEEILEDEIYEENNSENEFEEETNSSEEENDVAEESNLIEKYKEYRGIKSLSTCEYKTDNYPDYYKKITFFHDAENVERKIKNIKPIFENKMAQIKFKKLFNGNINSNVYAFCNIYDQEDKLTLLNIPFESEEEVPAEVIIDLGCRTIKASPLITGDSNDKVFIAKNEKAGIFSFVAPFTVELKNSYFFKENCSMKNLLGKTYAGYYGDRIVLERVKFVGYPIKFYKRECKIKSMFSNRDEVLFFRKLALRSESGQHGRITKPVGLSGIFKAYFDRPVKNGEPIYTYLYKRIYPFFE